MLQNNIIHLDEVRKIKNKDRTISDEAIASYTAANYSEALWITNRYLKAVLPNRTIPVLFFIIERTLRYHKEEENISLAQFIEGIIAENGTLHQAGTNLPKCTLIKAIKLLSCLEFITCINRVDRLKGNLANTYSINYKKLFHSAKTIAAMNREEVILTKLKVAKKYKDCESDGRIKTEQGTPPSTKTHQTLVQKRTKGSTKTHQPIKQSDLKQSEVNNQVVADAPTTDSIIFPIEENATDCRNKILSTVASAKSNYAARRRDKTNKLTQSGVKALWEEVCLELRPGQPIISAGPDKIKRVLAFLIDSRNAVASPRDFFSWAISTWPEFSNGRVEPWKTKYGETISPYPDLAYLAVFLGWFKREYAAKQVLFGPQIMPSIDSQLQSKDAQIKILQAKVSKLTKTSELIASVPNGRYWE